jgi:hypothetical protein
VLRLAAHQSQLMDGVDREVPIAISRLKYRAGTARSTSPDIWKLFVIGINREPCFFGAQGE